MMSSSQARPAVFVDRDDTLIEDSGYISDPDQVELLEGTASAIARLREAGLPVVVVSNQSGIARGLFSEEQLAKVHQRMQDLLQEQGTGVDAIYYCPYLDGPEAVQSDYRRDSDLRKPKPGMLLLAAEEMSIDLGGSWMVGDSERDVEAGRAAGCQAVLLTRSGTTASASADFVVADLPAAADLILSSMTSEGVENMNADRAPVTDCAALEDEQGDGQGIGADSPGDGKPVAAGDGDSTGSGVEATASEGSSHGDSPSRRADDVGLILEELRMLRREQQHVDFSIGKLAGAVAQAFALCGIGWGLYAWTNVASDSSAANTATLALLAGIAFQLMALTFFSVGGKK